MDTDRTSIVESPVVLRDLTSHEDMRSVEAIQIEVWGLSQLDVVPLTQLVAARASGGVLVGAYDGQELAGFVYGFCGYEDGRPTHHSHMLAVRPRYRRCDLGYRLKMAQRERVVAQGIDRMTWTFDPLQSLNAFLNFNKLGVVSDRYLVNFYGEDASSFLHRNGTDRLWVTWELTGGAASHRISRSPTDYDLPQEPAFLEVGADNGPVHRQPDGMPDRATVDIPLNVTDLERTDPEIARKWRDATRRAFIHALGMGYVIVGFDRAVRGDLQVGSYSLFLSKK